MNIESKAVYKYNVPGVWISWFAAWFTAFSKSFSVVFLISGTQTLSLSKPDSYKNVNHNIACIHITDNKVLFQDEHMWINSTYYLWLC